MQPYFQASWTAQAQLQLKTIYGLTVVGGYSSSVPTVSLTCSKCATPFSSLTTPTFCRRCRTATSSVSRVTVDVTDPTASDVLCEWLAKSETPPDPLTAILVASTMLVRVEKGKQALRSRVLQEEKRRARRRRKEARQRDGLNRRQVSSRLEDERREREFRSFVDMHS